VENPFPHGRKKAVDMNHPEKVDHDNYGHPPAGEKTHHHRSHQAEPQNRLYQTRRTTLYHKNQDYDAALIATISTWWKTRR
jgi:hypothetical protein